MTALRLALVAVVALGGTARAATSVPSCALVPHAPLELRRLREDGSRGGAHRVRR
jgi:hypothetical protein